MMKKATTIIIIFIFFFIDLKAQSPIPCSFDLERLNEQYWITRKRFKESFIINNIDKNGNLENDGIGVWDPNTNRYTHAGTGIPFANIGTHDIHNGSLAAPEDWDKYLGFLATEYGLLMKSGNKSEAQKTLNEIFLSLQAYRRLDMTANQFLKQWADLHVSSASRTKFLQYINLFFLPDSSFIKQSLYYGITPV